MPKGIGTYGGQIGRPLKKQKKYQEGGEVEAILEAVQMAQEFGSEFPTSDASFRSESYQLGGMVQPPIAPSITPPAYKKGGKVK